MEMKVHSNIKYLWQSRVENEHLIHHAFRSRVTAFKTQYLWTSVKGGAYDVASIVAMIAAVVTHSRLSD